MKLLRYGLMAIVLLSSTLLMGATQKKENPHWVYAGLEVGERVACPTVGHRYKMDDYMIDTNIAYTYSKYGFSSLSCSKLSTSLFKIFHSFEKSKFYGGVGVKIITGGKHYRYRHLYKDFAVLGMLTLGQEKNFEKGNKLFVEIFYCPFSWGYNHSNSIGWKIGLSL